MEEGTMRDERTTRGFAGRFIQAVGQIAEELGVEPADLGAADVLFNLDPPLLRDLADFRVAVAAAAGEVEKEEASSDEDDPQEDLEGPYFHLFDAWHSITDYLASETD
jgi:hypothetical protein